MRSSLERFNCQNVHTPKVKFRREVRRRNPLLSLVIPLRLSTQMLIEDIHLRSTQVVCLHKTVAVTLPIPGVSFAVNNAPLLVLGKQWKLRSAHNQKTTSSDDKICHSTGYALPFLLMLAYISTLGNLKEPTRTRGKRCWLFEVYLCYCRDCWWARSIKQCRRVRLVRSQKETAQAARQAWCNALITSAPNSSHLQTF